MSDEPPPEFEKAGMREILTDALRYWEWRRLFYNLALAAAALVEFVRHLPASHEALKFDEYLTLALLAVLANVAYCAAYLVDVFVQFSEFREQWRDYRGVFWLLGTVFAIVLTHFVATGVFAIPTFPPR